MWAHQVPWRRSPPLGAAAGARGVAVPGCRVVARPLSRAGTDTAVSGLTAASRPGTGFVMGSMPTILEHCRGCRRTIIRDVPHAHSPPGAGWIATNGRAPPGCCWNWVRAVAFPPCRPQPLYTLPLPFGQAEFAGQTKERVTSTTRIAPSVQAGDSRQCHNARQRKFANFVVRHQGSGWRRLHKFPAETSRDKTIRDRYFR